MAFLTLILAVIALIIAILAYQKAGGMADLKKQIEHITSSGDLRKSIDSLASASESMREKTAEAIGRLEAAFKKEQKKPPAKPAPRRRAARKKPSREKREAPSPDRTEPTS